MKFPKAETFYRRIVKSLKEGSIEAKISLHLFDAGRCDGDKITVNPEVFRSSNTIVHECLHSFYPNLTETEVLAMEREIHSQLSKYQRGMLTALLFFSAGKIFGSAKRRTYFRKKKNRKSTSTKKSKRR